jgi:hypothetical protein
MKRLISIVLVALVASLAIVASAGAERAVLPSGNVPWSDPAHNSPLEQVASAVASQIAERPVRIQCHSEAEWAALGLPSGALGVVRYLYNPYTGVIVATEDIGHIREAACGWTQLYGQSAVKPTRCATTETITKTVYDTVRVRKKVFYWVTVKTKKGKKKRIRKSRYIWVTKRVPRTVAEQVPGPSVPCYGSGQALPTDYRNYAIGLEVISHEAIHLFDERVGYYVQTQASAESRAECFGMQLLSAWAETWGGDPDDAHAIERFYYDVEYPKWIGSPYWRPDCVENGPLDINPNDGVWPRVHAEPFGGPDTLGSLAWGYRS